MEAIETWHAEHVSLPLRFGSIAELQAECRVAVVDRLPRASGNALRVDLPMLWVEGQDLVGGHLLWLLFVVVHSNSVIPVTLSSGCFEASCMGLVVGHHN